MFKFLMRGKRKDEAVSNKKALNLRGYREALPASGETADAYCVRLVEDGHEEMWIRAALRTHFDMELSEFPAFFEKHPEARFRHLELLLEIRPDTSEYSFTRKVAKNLGISDEDALIWINRFKDSRSLSF